MSSPRPAAIAALLEPLEPRIAPAVIINVGAPDDSDPKDTRFDEAPFVKAWDSADPGVASLFAAEKGKIPDPDAAPGVDLHYVLSLSAGDKVMMYPQWSATATPDQSYINLTAGKALAFFYDKNADLRVNTNELTGFALSTGAALKVAGSVDGDIIGNLDAKTGLLSVNDLTPNGTVASLNVAGSVNGSLISGGNISKVTISGEINKVSTSSDGTSPAGTYIYHFGGTGASAGVGEATLAAYAPAKGATGGNISTVSVGKVTEISGGVGGAGGTGGAISGVTVVSDYDGFTIIGGAGGMGTKGGNGGAVTNITVYGAAAPEGKTDVVGQISIQGGAGASPLATGAGGAGGAVSKIFVGFQPSGTKLIQSPIALNDYVTVKGGAGGVGTSAGGAGGLLSDINVYTQAPDDPAPGAIEIHIAGGHGGDGTLAAARGGIGGAVSKVLAVNLNDEDVTAPSKRDQILIEGGDAGSSAGAGANGGAVTDVSVMADHVSIEAGHGSDGTSGGAGGAISKVSLLHRPSDRVDMVSLAGGDGGHGTNGGGGAGGAISNVSGTSLDLTNLSSKVAGGRGGDSDFATGGAGGALTSISLFEPVFLPTAATIEFSAGDGGHGGKAGGIGGAISSLTFLGYATLPTVSAGDGGNATIGGSGGKGGAITNLGIKVFDVDPTTGTGIVSVRSGNGGNGSGSTGKGGAGGAINSATVQGAVTKQDTTVPGLDLEVVAGNGGGGGGGTVGAGGSASKISAVAPKGDVRVEAGSAGPAGLATKGAAGGALSNISASGLDAITISAGDGRLGGAGGSISSAVWFGVNPANRYSPDTESDPTGNVLIRAGQGSVGVGTTGSAGAGGSLTNLSGRASTVGTTEILAGDGNGGALGPRAAAGGSITGLSIYGGASDVEVIAGNGGSLSAGATGTAGKGGNISNVASASGVDFLAIAAGNGGNSGAGVAAGKGGLGGTINSINVFGHIGDFGDINTLSNPKFGLDGMGGLFAGAGGTGGEAKLNGKAGNVTNVTAAAISSIVAGRPTLAAPETLQLVNLVDKVYLRGLTAPTVDPATGAFDLINAPATLTSPSKVNYYEANLVGAVAGDPADPGANVYKVIVGGKPASITTNPCPWVLGTTKPFDGLVAAITLTANRNFRPQALLMPVAVSLSPTGYALVDYRNDQNINS